MHFQLGQLLCEPQHGGDASTHLSRQRLETDQGVSAVLFHRFLKNRKKGLSKSTSRTMCLSASSQKKKWGQSWCSPAPPPSVVEQPRGNRAVLACRRLPAAAARPAQAEGQTSTAKTMTSAHIFHPAACARAVVVVADLLCAFLDTKATPKSSSSTLPTQLRCGTRKRLQFHKKLHMRVNGTTMVRRALLLVLHIHLVTAIFGRVDNPFLHREENDQGAVVIRRKVKNLTTVSGTREFFHPCLSASFVTDRVAGR